jgi:ribosomal protein S18 acetylase RimI-like enzyme
MPRSIENHPVTIDAYIAAPCQTLSTAYWKQAAFPIPDGIRIEHATIGDMPAGGTAYFRLIHYPRGVYNPALPPAYAFAAISLPEQAGTVADLLNRCYPGSSLTAEDVSKWTAYPVHAPDLWVSIIDRQSGSIAALGIADLDPLIQEGSLEWIQVLPAYRRQGLGQAVVTELLRRMQRRVCFVTVSGQVDNEHHAMELYRKCGFAGDDVWVVKKEDEVASDEEVLRISARLMAENRAAYEELAK